MKLSGPTNPTKQVVTTFPAIREADGSCCMTPEQAVDRWVQFFSDIIATRSGVQDAPVRSYMPSGETISRSFATPAYLLNFVNSYLSATWSVHLHVLQAEDALPPELCRTHPEPLAKASYSQLLKIALHGQESLTHKGGHLVQAWKGKGMRDQCSSYRSLLVSSHQVKALHRALRQHHSGCMKHGVKLSRSVVEHTHTFQLGWVCIMSALFCLLTVKRVGALAFYFLIYVKPSIVFFARLLYALRGLMRIWRPSR